MKKKLVWLSGLSAGLGLVVPFFVSAQQISACSGVTNVNTLFDFICKLQNLLNAIVPFLVALGAIYFIWGVVQYVVASEEEAKKKGRNRMVYGIIGLVIIFAFWGLIRIVVNTLRTPNSGPQAVPCLPGQPC